MSLLLASVGTCVVLYGLLAAVLAAICIISNTPVVLAVIVVAVILVLQFIFAPYITDVTQKWFYKTDFKAEVPKYLENFIQQVCQDNNMKYPRIGFISDGAPNAFTYGHTKNDARIVLTQGLFDLLTEDEVKAVVAHELGHAKHYDMLLMTAVQIVPMLMYAIFDISIRAAQTSRGGNGGRDRGAVAIVALIAFVLYIISEYVILWLSRTREYYADEFSAQVTGDANALASALVNIGFGLSTRPKPDNKKKAAAPSQSALGIFDVKNSKSLAVECYQDGKIETDRIKDAMKWEMWNVWAFWYELGSTHPLSSKRINRLGKIAKANGQEPLVDFDLQKPESYADDFNREFFVSVLPTLGFIVLFGAGFIIRLQTGDITALSAHLYIGAVVWAAAFSSLKYLYTHPRKNYFEANTAGLLSEVKVSMVKSIPAELTGTIIGRGNPGCIFSEDFVLRDKTGILFLDYNQPMWIINKVFAMFRSPKYFDKEVKVKGWYRRNMVPFFELYSMEVDGEVKKCYSYGFGWIWRIALLVISGAMLVLSFL